LPYFYHTKSLFKRVFIMQRSLEDFQSTNYKIYEIYLALEGHFQVWILQNDYAFFCLLEVFIVYF